MGAVKIDKADKLWSLYVRTRDNWTCQRCFTRYEPPTSALHCSHFWGRGRESTRFDSQNCMAACYGCHRYLTAHPEEHRNFQLKRLGQREFDALMIRANTYHKKDRAMEVIRIKAMLVDLDKMLVV